MKPSLLLLAISSVATAALPPPTGTQGFADLGIPEANGSATGNILDATSFTIGDLVSTAAQSGIFMGLPTQSFGSFTFNINKGTSLSFGDGPWGRFTSTLIDPTVLATHAGATVSFFVVGNWTPGTFESKAGTAPLLSDFTISFTQTPGGAVGTISDSSTFSTPAVQASVPEPGPAGLLALGVIGTAIAAWRRRRK